ncbi:hypothetical protein ALMP_06210 [Streptomyces sp. A012304]|nr:hypothetical protein ALMP_06210 [Streptomyces sp. A012304]
MCFNSDEQMQQVHLAWPRTRPVLDACPDLRGHCPENLSVAHRVVAEGDFVLLQPDGEFGVPVAY